MSAPQSSVDLAPEDRDLFVQETRELLEVLEQGLVGLEGAESDSIHALFRAAHTIKGNVGMVGATHCGHFTHVLENVLARIRDGALPVDSGIIDRLLPAVDVLRTLVDGIARGEANPELVGHEELLESLSELSTVGEATESAASQNVERVLRVVLSIPTEEPVATLRGALEEIVALGKVLTIEPPLDTADAREFRFDLRATLRKADIDGMLLFSNATATVETLETAEVAGKAPAPAEAPVAPEADKPAVAVGAVAAAAPQKARRKAGGVVKVDADRLDQLLDLVGELTIALGFTRRTVENTASTLTHRREALEVLDRLSSDVHERVMSLRMVAVRDTFERMRRPVHDAAQQLGKEVTVETEGVDTELDRKLLDELADPLTHMVRNAVAHGIESPAARAAAGKPRAGRLVVRALRRNGSALIEVEDDGAGIDAAKVKKRAVERGLVTEDATLSEQDTYALLFAPGFSTAEAVNQIAGRGVGLDVVVKNVERLRGRVEITSRLGHGSTFRIRLPLTLAVIEGMNVRVGRETVSIPLREVEEILDPATSVQTIEGKTEYLDVRGEMLPLVRLGALLGMAGAAAAGNNRGDVVLLKSDRRRFAVAVDGVLGMSRTVVKSVERSMMVCAMAAGTYERSPALGGATILDDGTVGYVLDVQGLDSMAFG